MKGLKKKPIQIYLEPQQSRALDALSRRRGVSKAEIVRESLDKLLKSLPVEEDPAITLVGLGNSGKKDLSKNHDRYLAGYVTSKGK